MAELRARMVKRIGALLGRRSRLQARSVAAGTERVEAIGEGGGVVVHLQARVEPLGAEKQIRVRNLDRTIDAASKAGNDHGVSGAWRRREKQW